MENQDSPIPVIVVVQDLVSGVVSWALRLRDAFKNHNRYQVHLLQLWQANQASGDFDLFAPSWHEFRALFTGPSATDFTNAIIVPNWNFGIVPWCSLLNKKKANLRVLGIAHSDSADEYYDALVWASPMVSQFIGVSDVICDHLRERMPNRKQDIAQLVYGVNVPPALARAYQTKPIRLIYAGRIVQQQKRVLEFIPLIYELIERGIDFRFDFAGEGKEEALLRQALAPAVELGRVRFLGVIPPQDMASVWAAHDVFLQISEYEGTSVSMLEAMSQGVLPVVTDSSSGVRSVIKPGRNGFVAPVGNITEIATYIERLIQFPHWLPALGQEAYRTAQNYSMESYVTKFEEVLDRTQADTKRYWPGERTTSPPGIYSMKRPNPLGEQTGDQLRSAGVNLCLTLTRDMLDDTVPAWIVNLHHRLRERGYPSTLIDLRSLQESDEANPNETVGARFVRLPLHTTPQTELRDIKDIHAPFFQSLLPAMLIVGAESAIFAACAHLSETHADALRVLALLHADDTQHYDMVEYYEPIIHGFIALSPEIDTALRSRLASRNADIVTVSPIGPAPNAIMMDAFNRAWNQNSRHWPKAKSLLLAPGKTRAPIAG